MRPDQTEWADAAGLPHERTAILEMREVRLVAVDEAQIVLAPDEQHGRVRAEAPDLRQPHRRAVAQGLGVTDREAQQHYIRPKKRNDYSYHSSLLTVHVPTIHI